MPDPTDPEGEILRAIARMHEAIEALLLGGARAADDAEAFVRLAEKIARHHITQGA